MGGIGSVELKKCSPFPAELWLANGRERKPRQKKKKLSGARTTHRVDDIVLLKKIVGPIKDPGKINMTKSKRRSIEVEIILLLVCNAGKKTDPLVIDTKYHISNISRGDKAL